MSSSVIKSKGVNKNTIYYFNSLITILLIFGFGLLPTFSTVTPLGMKVLGVFLGMLYGWTTVSLFWPSIAGILMLALAGAMPIKQVFAVAFGNETVWLIVFVMVFATFVEAAGVSNIIAMWFVTKKVFFGKPWLFTCGFLLMTFLLSAATSTMPAIIICWGILYGICKELGYKPGDKYPALMVLGVVYACTLGLGLLPFKTVSLGIMGVYKELSGISIPYLNYVCFTFPLCVLSIIAFTLLGKFVFKPDVGPLKNLNRETFGEAANIHIDKKQKIVLGFLVTLIVLLLIPSVLPKQWFLAQVLNSIGGTGVVMGLCALMALLKVNGEPLFHFGKMAARGLQWDVVILTAAVMAVVPVLTADNTGIAPFLSASLAPLFAGKPTILFIGLVVLIAVILTNFCNNAITGILLVTITYNFILNMGVNPTVLAMLIIYCVHLAILTPAGSPMAALLHSNKEWISTGIIYKYGLIAVAITGVLVFVVGLPLAQMLF